MPLDAVRWEKLCQSLHIAVDAEEFARLDQAYAEPQRGYHTAQHINECLARLDWALAQQDCPALSSSEQAIVAAALWYHDAVYQPTQHDNEIKSADWALAFLGKAGVPAGQCELLHSLIMATSHGESPQETPHQLLVDIDLSILGASPERFAEFGQQIRHEYSRVPLELYRKRRGELLRFFLAKPRLYCLDIFRDAQELQARQNLTLAIAELDH